MRVYWGRAVHSNIHCDNMSPSAPIIIFLLIESKSEEKAEEKEAPEDTNEVCEFEKCCSWEGECGGMGDDGTGWCHAGPENCAKCDGEYIEGTPKGCNNAKESNTEPALF